MLHMRNYDPASPATCAAVRACWALLWAAQLPKVAIWRPGFHNHLPTVCCIVTYIHRPHRNPTVKGLHSPRSHSRSASHAARSGTPGAALERPALLQRRPAGPPGGEQQRPAAVAQARRRPAAGGLQLNRGVQGERTTGWKLVCSGSGGQALVAVGWWRRQQVSVSLPAGARAQCYALTQAITTFPHPAEARAQCGAALSGVPAAAG